MPRLAGLETITTAPVLFFTINDGIVKNPRANAVLTALQQRLQPGSRCKSFISKEHLREYLNEKSIPDWASIRLLDIAHDKKFLSHDYQAKGWPNLFTIGILSKVTTETRVEVAARQIAANFEKNFLANLDRELFPWGSPRKNGRPPKPVNTRWFFARAYRPTAVTDDERVTLVAI